MTKNNNVTPISSMPNKNTVTLEKVLQALQAWRDRKTPTQRTIPTEIWDKILCLIEQGSISRSKILKAAGISVQQLQRAEAERAQNATSPQVMTEAEGVLDFCEVTQNALAYKPAEAFTTTTSVVELYRPDGMLMKIHICTDRFEELLRAFFKG
jgi:hypothetical protein